MNKTQPTIALVDQIHAGPGTVAEKTIKFFAIAMLNYRGPVGEHAWSRMGQLIGGDVVPAFSFLSGFCMAHGSLNSWGEDRFRELVPELREL